MLLCYSRALCIVCKLAVIRFHSPLLFTRYAYGPETIGFLLLIATFQTIMHHLKVVRFLCIVIILICLLWAPLLKETLLWRLVALYMWIVEILDLYFGIVHF